MSNVKRYRTKIKEVEVVQVVQFLPKEGDTFFEAFGAKWPIKTSNSGTQYITVSDSYLGIHFDLFPEWYLVKWAEGTITGRIHLYGLEEIIDGKTTDNEQSELDALRAENKALKEQIASLLTPSIKQSDGAGIIELKSILHAVRFMPKSDDVSYEVFGKVYPIEYIDGKRYIDLDPNFTDGGGIAFESCYIFKNSKGDIWVDEELPPYYEVQ